MSQKTSVFLFLKCVSAWTMNMHIVSTCVKNLHKVSGCSTSYGHQHDTLPNHRSWSSMAPPEEVTDHGGLSRRPNPGSGPFFISNILPLFRARVMVSLNGPTQTRRLVVGLSLHKLHTAAAHHPANPTGKDPFLH